MPSENEKIDNESKTPIIIHTEELDQFINQILQTKSFSDGITVLEQSIDIKSLDPNLKYTEDELKLRGIEMMFITVVKYMAQSNTAHAQANFEMNILHNHCTCSEN